jgi:hypothetical protein
VLIYEEHFVFYRRKSVYHFNEYNNCAHEGTNFGAKSHAAQLLPSHTILQAGKTMVFQAAIKCKEIFVEAEKNMHSQKLWSDTPTAAHLTKLGESLVTTSWKRATQYKGARVSANQWEVEYASSSAENEILDVSESLTCCLNPAAICGTLSALAVTLSVVAMDAHIWPGYCSMNLATLVKVSHTEMFRCTGCHPTFAMGILPALPKLTIACAQLQWQFDTSR